MASSSIITDEQQLQQCLAISWLTKRAGRSDEIESFSDFIMHCSKNYLSGSRNLANQNNNLSEAEIKSITNLVERTGQVHAAVEAKMESGEFNTWIQQMSSVYEHEYKRLELPKDVDNPVHDWDSFYEVKLGLSSFLPMLSIYDEMIELAIEDNEPAEAIESLKVTSENIALEVSNLIHREAFGPQPLADAYVRVKAFAMSEMALHNRNGDDEFYISKYQDENFAQERAHLRCWATVKEAEEQASSANDETLSYYIEALTAYYCNRLCNLADGGDRKCFDEDGELCQKLKQYTIELEEREMFLEMWIVRSSVIGTFAARMCIFLKPLEEKMLFDEKANEMLCEFYTKGFTDRSGKPMA